jgi:hypothetical protein
MSFDNSAKNVMITAAVTNVTAMGIHTADPGTGADNEVTGSGYTRKAPTFSSATNGVVTLAAAVDFDGPASANALFYTLWAGSTRYAKGAITGTTTFNADGKFRVLSGTTFTVA